MAKHYSHNVSDSLGYTRVYSVDSRDSLTNGKVDKTKPCEYSLTDCEIVQDMVAVNPWTGRPQRFEGAQGANPANFPSFNNYRSNAEQKALAKFRGKLRQGGASLGITLATYAQSRDMIVDRSKKLVSGIAEVEKSLATQRGQRIWKRHWKRQLKKHGRLRANDLLEAQFGWGPLLQDVYNAMHTLVQYAHPGEYIRASQGFAGSTTAPGEVTRTYRFGGRVTIASYVVVENPNLWLASRAGALNPAQVLWDAIPWSWVVGMFVNVNSILGQFTDYAGLRFERQSVTTVAQGLVEYVGNSGMWAGSTGFSTGVSKRRTVGSIPSVSWQFRIPDLDVALAVTATALVLQRMNKLSSLVTKLVGRGNALS